MRYTKINKPLYTIVFFLSINVIGFAQISSEGEEIRKKYPKSSKVTTYREHRVSIELNNGEIEILQNIIEEEFFLDDAATKFSKESVRHSSFFVLEDLQASSFNLEGGKYKEYEVEEFREKDDLEGSFHDDLKWTSFVYPNLNKYSKTRLKLKESIKNPRFLNSFYFGGFYPVLKSKLIIEVGKGIEISFKEFNTENIIINYSKKEKRNKTIHIFESENVDAIDIEDRTPNIKFYYPHVVPTISKYKNSENESIELSSSVGSLYSWYYSLVKNINTEPVSDEIQNLVNTLIKGKDSEVEKVRSIYYWVQSNIKYIAFEYALGGFVPRNANEVFKKKYGDCKDNSSILAEMLKAANIEGNLTWVGTRSIPYKYEELPTPAVDNHMILTFQSGEIMYFLDATGRYISLDMPTSFIQGKEALVAINENEFKIVKIPVIESGTNETKTVSNLIIDNKLLKGKATTSFTGYSKIEIFHEIDDLISEKSEQEYFKELLQIGNNKFSFSKLSEINKFSYDKNYFLEYDLEVSDYLIGTPNEIFINLNLNKKLLEFRIEPNRKTDIEIDFKQRFVYENTLAVPEDFKITYLPEDIEIENEFLKASFKYVKMNNSIKYNHSIDFKFLVFPIKRKDIYDEMIRKVEKAYKEIVILEKK